MADSELDILIKLGVIGKEDAAAAMDLVKENTGELRGEMDKFSSESLPENLKGWDKYKDRLHEGGLEALDTKEKMHLLHLAGRSLGGTFEEVARMGGLVFNPLTAGAAIGGVAINGIFEHLAKVQEKYRDLINDGQQVNNIIREIVSARPTATKEWMEFTEQVAKLHQELKDSKFAMDQFISVQKQIDDNKLKTAFDFQKPGLEQQGITNDLANTQAALNQRQRNAGNVDEAQRQANETRSKADDYRKEIEELPSAIAAAKANAAKAREDATHTFSPWSKKRLRDFAQDQDHQAANAEKVYDNAVKNFPGAANAAAAAETNLRAVQENNSQMAALREKIVELTNKLGVTQDLNHRQVQHDQIQGVIDAGKGSGHSLGEMGNAIGITQQQQVNIATRIINHQLTLQQVQSQMLQRLAVLERQGKQEHLNNH